MEIASVLPHETGSSRRQYFAESQSVFWKVAQFELLLSIYFCFSFDKVCATFKKKLLLRSSSLLFNVVLGKLSVLKQQKLFYKGLFKESINYSKYSVCLTLRLRKSVNDRWRLMNISTIVDVEPKNMTTMTIPSKIN